MQLHEIRKTYKDEVDNLRLYYCNQYAKILQSILSECGFTDVDVVRIVDGKTGVITIDYDSYASKFPSLFFLIHIILMENCLKDDIIY